MITGRIGAERKFSKNPKAMHGASRSIRLALSRSKPTIARFASRMGLLRLKANRIDRLSRFASRMGRGTQSSNKYCSRR